MSERMDRAMRMADECWKKAMRVSPEFVSDYLHVAEHPLLCNPEVSGDRFKKACVERGVILPEGLHHNTWVSGPRFLERIGWVTRIKKVIPLEMHNHMPSVTLWQSNVTF